MTVQEASERTSISKDMIRHYEKIGLIRPKRKDNGYRDYSEDDLNTLVLIRMLSNSRIPLKTIKEAFLKGTADTLISGLDKEVKHVQKLQTLLAAREEALKIEMDCFRQFNSGGTMKRCHYPNRWYIRRSAANDTGFERDYQEVIRDDHYFHYSADLNASVSGQDISFAFSGQGVILYSSHPDALMIPEQDCLRTIVTHPAGTMLGAEKTVDIIRQASEIQDKETYKMLAYQIFHTFGGREKCVVCVEVLLGENRW